MKEEICSLNFEIQNISSENSTFYQEELKEDNLNNNNYVNDPHDEVKKQKENNHHETKKNYDKNYNSPIDQEKYLVNKLKILYTGKLYPVNFLQFSDKEKINFLCNYITSEEDGCTNGFKKLPNDLVRFFIASQFEGDCGRSSDVKPDWLDLEKFKRGQKFAMDHYFGLSYAQLLSLFILFSFEDGIKPLILTGKSSTPYTAFKRYTSTGLRIRNWYTDNPWEKGTKAYNDIQTVKKMHAAVRKRLMKSDFETIDAATKIENPFCPSRDILLKDFNETCPPEFVGQTPFMLIRNPELNFIKPKGLNQADMALTQFGFCGLIILYPEYFGVFHVTDDDMEAFCHTWRGIGYLLGIDDEFNFCRGSLNEVRQRCKDFVELWAIPNFRELTPECEHMLRCVVESLQYSIPGTNYETCVLYLAEMLNLQLPRLYSSLTYRMWIRHIVLKFFYRYTCQVPGVMSLLNKRASNALDKAANFSAEKHEELKKRSEETLRKGVNNINS